MNKRMRLAGALSAVALAATLVAVPQVQAGGTFAYKPPMRGVPSEATRVGGGTRGAQGRTFTLSVLAPEELGLTTRAQPTLLWFTSDKVTAPVQVTIVDPDQIEPVLDVKLDPPLKPGVQSISLEKYGVRLKPNVDYQWFVALITDPQHRSQDVIAGSEIRRVVPEGDVEAKVKSASPADLPRVYAESGIWYDAIDGLSQLIAQQPGDAALRAQRAALLEQIGLGEAAAFDRRGS
jgi:hypothetical protein